MQRVTHTDQDEFVVTTGSQQAVHLLAAVLTDPGDVVVVDDPCYLGASQVLQAGGVQDLFEAQVDGQVAEERHLPGKPDPAVFLEAARQLGAQPRRTVVVEDAVAGVKAGKAGGFGLVIGIDRGGNAERLKQNGADVVVKDLEEVKLLV